MARWQDVMALASAALSGDRERTLIACKTIKANEGDNSSLKVAMDNLLSRQHQCIDLSEQLPPALKGLVLPITPKIGIEEITLPQEVEKDVNAFIAERGYTDLFRDQNLAAPHKILLSGPPGNGKTTLAGGLAKKLNIPFYVADFSKLISSFLGQTGGQIATLFRCITGTSCVLFIDEMETVLCERAGNSNFNDVGETRRIVSTLLLEIDRLPDHVILIGATNHEEMLDRAVVRRFDYQWQITQPEQDTITNWLQKFARRHPNIPILSHMPADVMEGSSISDIERAAFKWCRRWLMENKEAKA